MKKGRPKGKEETKTLIMRVSPKLKNDLKVKARKYGTDMTTIARMILLAGLKQI